MAFSKIMSQKGFSAIVVVIIVSAVLIGALGTYFVMRGSKNAAPTPSTPPAVPIPQPTQTQTQPQTQRQPQPSSQISPQASSAPSQLTISWIRDNGARISNGSVPYIYKLADGKYRLYFCGDTGILSAISNDGLNFTRESGARITPGAYGGSESSVCDPTLISLGNGQVRIYYKGANGTGGPGQAVHKIFSAISSDGLNFIKEGIRIDSQATGDNGWASVPEAVKLPDGKIRIYYVSGDFAAQGGIMSAISKDGLNFTKESGARVKGMADPAVTILPDGNFILFASSINSQLPPYLPTGIYSFTSADGLTFNNRQMVLQDSNVFDPSVMRMNDNTFRVYYGNVMPGTTPFVKSVTGTYTRQ